MTLKFKLLPSAIGDLGDIWDYIAQDNPQAATALLLKIEDNIRLLCTQPRMGNACPEFQAGLYRMPFGQYIIFYVPTDTQLVVVRILHGARDIETLFQHE